MRWLRNSHLYGFESQRTTISARHKNSRNLKRLPDKLDQFFDQKVDFFAKTFGAGTREDGVFFQALAEKNVSTVIVVVKISRLHVSETGQYAIFDSFSSISLLAEWRRAAGCFFILRSSNQSFEEIAEKIEEKNCLLRNQKCEESPDSASTSRPRMTSLLWHILFLRIS